MLTMRTDRATWRGQLLDRLTPPRRPIELNSIVLFAHGSRDPLWRVPIESVAKRIQEKEPGLLVSIAYLELNDPDLKTSVQELLSRGAHCVRIFPLFLGVGKHARQDLPVLVDEIKALHPQTQIEVLPSAGEMPQVVDFLSDMALSELVVRR